MKRYSTPQQGPTTKRKSRSVFEVPPAKKVHSVPKADPEANINKTFTFSTHNNASTEDLVIKGSKAFSEIPPKDIRTVFHHKCRECSKICNFSSPTKDSKAKTAKQHLLKHLYQGFSIPHLVRSLTADLMQEFFQMVSVNILRPFPKFKHGKYMTDARDSLMDSAWPHLSLVYDCLLASLTCSNLLNFPPHFINKLINNCLSPDDRERHSVRNVLCAIYQKCHSQRIIMRNSVAMICNTGKCTTELLDFFVGVVGSFTSPLKPELIALYYQTVLPLHRLRNYNDFHSVLVQVITRFIAKADVLLAPTFSYLHKHWPLTDCNKQSLFLREMEEIAITFSAQITTQVLATFMRRVGDCVLVEYSTLAETALDIIQNPLMAPLLRANSASLFFMLILHINNTSKSHWDEDVKETANSALAFLQELDKNAYKKANETQKMMKNRKLAAFGVCKTTWNKIFDAARGSDPDLVAPNMKNIQ